jgi:hypothetical protein
MVAEDGEGGGGIRIIGGVGVLVVPDVVLVLPYQRTAAHQVHHLDGDKQ